MATPQVFFVLLFMKRNVRISRRLCGSSHRYQVLDLLELDYFLRFLT